MRKTILKYLLVIIGILVALILYLSLAGIETERFNNQIKSRVIDRPHPATFPIKLAENCIRLHGVKKNTIVLDPFVGIGHAPLGAIRCGVKKFIGFDINPEYLKIAKEKIKPFDSNYQESTKST